MAITTILDTDKFKLNIEDDTHLKSITINGKTFEIDWSMWGYQNSNDFIIEYKTSKFSGYVMLSNLGVTGIELTVVKVNTGSDYILEFMGDFSIDKYESVSDVLDFKYNTETEEFTIISKTLGDTVFKLKDLEKDN